MEIIIGLIVVVFGIWWLVLREKTPEVTSVPYKVETPPTPEPIVEIKVEEPTPIVEAAVETVVPVEVPAKKPRKPRAPKVATTPAATKVAPKKAATKKPAARTVRSKKA